MLYNLILESTWIRRKLSINLYPDKAEQPVVHLNLNMKIIIETNNYSNNIITTQFSLNNSAIIQLSWIFDTIEMCPNVYA